MNHHILLVVSSLIFISGCQNLSGATKEIVTEISCDQTWRAYHREIDNNPDKMKHPEKYPEIKTYLDTIKTCEKGFIIMLSD